MVGFKISVIVIAINAAETERSEEPDSPETGPMYPPVAECSPWSCSTLPPHNPHPEFGHER